MQAGLQRLPLKQAWPWSPKSSNSLDTDRLSTSSSGWLASESSDADGCCVITEKCGLTGAFLAKI